MGVTSPGTATPYFLTVGSVVLPHYSGQRLCARPSSSPSPPRFSRECRWSPAWPGPFMAPLPMRLQRVPWLTPLPSERWRPGLSPQPDRRSACPCPGQAQISTSKLQAARTGRFFFWQTRAPTGMHPDVTRVTAPARVRAWFQLRRYRDAPAAPGKIPGLITGVPS